MNIELKNIYFAYDRDNYILKDLSVKFREGETVAVIGQNGSGKTTLVKQLNGILKPSKGEILFDGESVAGKSTAKLSAKVGYVFQNPDDQLFLPTVLKELEFGPQQIGYPESDCMDYAREAASVCGITSYLDDHPLDLGASKKKLCTIAAVLSMQTDVVILDEPTMGQDREGNRKLTDILAYLKDQGKTCIAISHDMKFVAGNFDRVVVLKGGEIWMDGTAAEVFARPDMLKQSYISPPPITGVCQKSHIGDAVFSVEQFSELLKP